MGQFFKISAPPRIVGYAAVVGPKEAQGPLADEFDIIFPDDTMGQKTFEKAEGQMFLAAMRRALEKAGLLAEDISFMIGGDLLNQTVSADFTARDIGIPFLGIYGACSNMAESMILASMLLSGGYGQRALCVTGSHFSTAERQYRFPLEHGNQRTPTAQWTVTASGCTVLERKDGAKGPRVESVTIGRVVDMNIKDANNMGAAMAPAAADTILDHYRKGSLPPDYYDMVFTGDLGSLGQQLCSTLLKENGLSIDSRYGDCGSIIFQGLKNVGCGGSGCGCSASVFNSYILNGLKKGKWRRVLLVATGALFSPLTSQQGESIPCIAHAVGVEA